MTKLLLSCDDYAYLYKGNYYTKPELMFFYQRYLRVFDKIRVVCRCLEEKELSINRVPFQSYPNIEIYPVPFFQGPKEYLKVYLKVGRSTQKAIEGCDVAIIRIPSTVALRVGKCVKQTGIPYACEVVFDAQDGWKGEKGLNRLAWKLIDKQMRGLCSTADGVSCVTEKYLQQHYFPTSSDAFTSNYSSLALPETFYSGPRTFPQKDTFIIAHTANQVEFNGRKGQNELLYTLKELKQKRIKVKLRFAGKDYFGGVEKLHRLAVELGVEEMVDFTGFLSRKELDNFLENADLFVMPTKAEGLPRVIIEAMAKGLPCITTPVSGNPELIDSHFLVSYEDTNTLANRVEELCSNVELYELISRVNFERSKKYEASLLQARRDDFYMKLKERARRRL